VKTLYRASRVHTLAHPATGEWVVVDGRHVMRVGSGDPPQADRVVDLPGATIVPGFVDAHVHLTGTGAALANEDVTGARSAAEVLALARGRAAEGEGPVVLMGFDETRWDRPGMPTLGELDEVTSRPLVLQRADGHVSLANTAAIEGAGLVGLADEPGLVRDEDGRLSGRVTQEANSRLARWAESSLGDHERQSLQLKAAALAASRGVTSIHEMSMPHWHGFHDLEVLIAHRARLPVDLVTILATTDVPEVIDLGFEAIGGDLPVDGSIGARTAALVQPYLDTATDGVAYFEDDQLAEFFQAGHAAGLQVGVHAIGDRGIDQVLRTWERVYQMLDSRERRHFRARRHRIEHFEMVDAAMVERAAVLGLAASVQPAFDRLWGQEGGLYEIGVGSTRAAGMNPFRTMLDRGLEIGAGSDAPVTSLDPMLSIAACEQHHHPAERLDRHQAIRLHTVGGARLAHQEEKKGALGPGMHADFAAYPEDPFEAPDVRGLRPILTVSLGREVFAG
jgi:predicted amidohydrolase YtcJ